MTPMAKFIIIVLATGDVLIYETITSIVVSAIKTQVTNCSGVWASHSNIDNEFKIEGKL